ncbi:MAG: hypothetical protein ACJ798_15590, partial [Phenylobacterium sp.]
PRYDFNWQRAYTFAQPVKIPAGSKLIAHYWYDNSKRNPANPDPSIEVTWGEQSFQEMLFTQVNFRWLDETAAQQVDSDSRFRDSQLMGAMDDNLDGKLQKAELRGQIGKAIGEKFDILDANHDGALDKAELAPVLKQMMGGRRREAGAGAPATPASATPAAAGR